MQKFSAPREWVSYNYSFWDRELMENFPVFFSATNAIFNTTFYLYASLGEGPLTFTVDVLANTLTNKNSDF